MYLKSPFSLTSSEAFDAYAHSAAVFRHGALATASVFDPHGPLTQQSFTGTSGDDDLDGTGGADTFDLSQGGNDIAGGKAGYDTFFLGDTLTADDQIDGGPDSASVELSGDYSAGVTFHSNTLKNVDTLTLDGGGDYKFVLNDANVADAGFLIVTLVTPGAGVLNFDASAEVGADVAMISSADGADTLIGGTGNDYVDGGAPDNDVLDGGGGINRVSFSSLTASISISLLEHGVQDVGHGFSLTLNNFQDLQGTKRSDTLTGDGQDNWIDTNGGNDTVDAGGGDDLVSASDRPTFALVTADGGDGADTLSFLFSFVNSLGAHFSLAHQGELQHVDALRDMVATNFENASGSVWADRFTGDSGDNGLFGDDGDDRLYGGNGDDVLYGDKAFVPLDDGHSAPTFARGSFGVAVAGVGEDVLKGGAGDDVLDGGGDGDKLEGDAGVDTLLGGSGGDVFVFRKASDSGVGSANRDVLDFSQSDGDTINLHHVDADTTLDGNQNFHLGGSEFTGTVRELIQFTEGGHTVVAGDVDGDGAADFELQLTTVQTLADGDFVF